MLMRIAVLAVLLVMVGGTVCASEVAEGQVVSVGNCVLGTGVIHQVLTIRTQSNEQMEFAPRLVHEGDSWLAARPARTMLPALEAGETVRITWTMDTKENRRRIDTIEVTSPLERNSRGAVVSRSASELVIRPVEKPGAVTLNTKWVQVQGKWLPDPEISRIILGLKAGDKATINWAWDKEGRKRILAISDIESAPSSKERK